MEPARLKSRTLSFHSQSSRNNGRRPSLTSSGSQSSQNIGRRPSRRPSLTSNGIVGLETPDLYQYPETPFPDRADRTDCGWQLVIRESNRFRQFAELVLAVLLVYTGTFYPYHLCFDVFHMTIMYEESWNWVAFEVVVDILWWVDLGLNFFYTYRESNREVDVLADIAKHYLRTFFVIDLIACLPLYVFEPMMAPADRGKQSQVVEIVRFSKLPRVARLLRLYRLLRLAKFVTLSERVTYMRWLFNSRFMKTLKFAVFLIWVVHILACGWYLCAALHERPEDTWVFRREVASAGGGSTTPLTNKGPFEQWLHSMYFVVTVFTTVGFGDISAFTVGEIVYACWAMLVGTILHSIVVGEILSTIMSKDDAQCAKAKRKAVLDAFMEHTQVKDPSIRSRLMDFARVPRQEIYCDKEEIVGILCSNTMPQALLNELPFHVFSGKITGNRLLTSCIPYVRELPTHLALLIAVAVDVCYFDRHEIVYQLHEHPAAIFLVEAGVFAHVGKAHRCGGIDAAPSLVQCVEGELKHDRTTSTHSKGSAAITKMVSRSVVSQMTQVPIASANANLNRLLMVTAKMNSSPHRTSKLVQKHLFPYHLVCFGSYFGDLDLFTTSARSSTVRCESPESSILALKKKDLLAFIEDFPQIGVVWRNLAHTREKKRKNALANLTSPVHSVEHLAVATIQRHFRCRHGTGANLRRVLSATASVAIARASSTRACAEQTPKGSLKSPEAPPASAFDKWRQDLQADLSTGLQTLQNELHNGLRELRQSRHQTQASSMEPALEQAPPQCR